MPVKKQLHGQLVKAVRQLLEADGWRTVGIRAGAFSEKGIWDIYADRFHYVHAGAGDVQVLWVECKTGKDTLSKDQKQFKDNRDLSGVMTCVVYRLEDLEGMGILSKRIHI